MALKKCSECGHEISTLAAACPNCGAPVKSVGPPPVPAVPPPLPVKSNRKRVWGILIAGGALFVIVCLFFVVLLFSFRGSNSESKVQAAITSALQEEFSRDKQQRYEKIHLAGELGTAKKDVIQSVSVQWKGGHATDNVADVAGFTVDHTLYWQTPLTADGYTRLSDTYDCSSGTPELTNSNIVATNGITIGGAKNALINYGAKEIKKAIGDMLNGTPSPAP